MVTMSSSATSVCSGTSKSPYCESGKGSTSYQLYPDADIQTVSPFVKYENKEQPYIWPSLYEEMDDMFDACCLIYALAELRQKARQAEFNDPTILNLPLTAFEVWKMVQSNQQHLKDCYFGKSFYLELLAILAKRHQKLAASSGSLINKRLQTQLVTFNDCNYQEEMVYGIAVNPIQQRISICFRGSVTKMDWNIDEEIYMTAVGNPVPASKIYAGSKLLIHDGFYKYLCAPLSQIRQQAEMNFKESEKPDEHEELSQYQVMLQFHIIPLLKQYPGYKLYVTGHSLGGALATLYSFLIAAEPDSVIPKPVTCISFGSPYVGDESFRLSHQTLESLGKLRNLRVSNYQDMVTLIPFISFRWKVWDNDAHVGTLFKHVGMNLRLFPPDSLSVLPFQIIYPKVRTGLFTAALDEFKRAWEYSLLGNWSWDWHVYFTWKVHSLDEYQRRINDNQPTLQVMYLDDLYANKAIVGHLIADF